jgi:uncharacterized protein (DUF433 family)
MATMVNELHEYRDRIIQDPEILAGKPVVAGARIPLDLVLAKLARNPDLDELFADYPRLTMDDLKACLAFAHALIEKYPRQRMMAAKAGVSL